MPLLLATLMLGWRAPCAAQGSAGGATVDSLVTYIEALEYDLAIKDADCVAVRDSLEVELRVLGWEVEALSGNQRRWYHDQRLWFLAGAISATVVMGATLQITF